MRTYYTTAVSTWGVQSFESYTGNLTTETTYTASSSTTAVGGGETFADGSTSRESYSVTSNYTHNYSQTSAESSASEYSCATKTTTSTEHFEQASFSTFDRYYSASSFTSSSHGRIAYQLTNLTGSSLVVYDTSYYTSYFSDTWTVLDRWDNAGTIVTLDASSSTVDQTSYSVVSSTIYSGGVPSVSYFTVGSKQVTVATPITYNTTGTLTSVYAQTYGSTSSSIPYTYTSYASATITTSSTSSASSQTTTQASTTITVTMNPRVYLAVASERSTEERMFVLTSYFQNTTMMLSQALSESTSYVRTASTTTTNSESSSFTGVSYSSSTGSTDTAFIYPQATLNLTPLSTDGPYVNTNPYFGGYSLGTTTVSWGLGVFDITYQNPPSGPIVTQRFTNSSSYVDTFTAKNVRIWPLSFLEFGSTTTASNNDVFAFTTTSLAGL